jgi:uncharacterized membrane protein
MNDDAKDLLDNYLQEITMFAQGLPPEARAELIAGVTEHLRAAQEAGEANDVAAAQALLDRLGAPEAIVRDASGSSRAPVDGVTMRRIVRQVRGTGRETIAILLITVGSFVPIIGWVAGMAVAWGI